MKNKTIKKNLKKYNNILKELEHIKEKNSEFIARFIFREGPGPYFGDLKKEIKKEKLEKSFKKN